jgi:hypothetical protein
LIIGCFRLVWGDFFSPGLLLYYFSFMIIKLSLILPTGLTAAERISVASVDHITSKKRRLGVTSVTIHYCDDGKMKERQVKLPWPGQAAEELVASRRIFEAHGIETD